MSIPYEVAKHYKPVKSISRPVRIILFIVFRYSVLFTVTDKANLLKERNENINLYTRSYFPPRTN